MFKVQVKAIDSETVYRETHHNNTAKAFFHCMRPLLRSRQLAKGYVGKPIYGFSFAARLPESWFGDYIEKMIVMLNVVQ